MVMGNDHGLGVGGNRGEGRRGMEYPQRADLIGGGERTHLGKIFFSSSS